MNESKNDESINLNLGLNQNRSLNSSFHSNTQSNQSKSGKIKKLKFDQVLPKKIMPKEFNDIPSKSNSKGFDNFKGKY